MKQRLSGVVTKIVFQNLTATYHILELANGRYFQYHGRDCFTLEFRLGEHVSFDTIFGIDYVINVARTYLKVENIPPEPPLSDETEAK